MISSARTQRLEILSQRLLITRIITALVLALLLILSAAGASHSESEGTWTSPLLVNALVDPHVTVGEGGSTIDEHLAGSADDESTGILVGAALCALGVLCGLVLVIFARMLSRRRGVVYLAPRWAALSLVPVRLIAAPTGALSLTQLGLSRT
ncbi:hypothetical protein V2S04_07420 [Microbacterium sp. OR21]|uniref:hypothetical protein n=1 Tax=Microbacterium sp. OR21 TaxID=3095346 RepID=UPI0039B531A5